MKLKEIYKLALNRLNAHEGDKQIESIVMAGINAATKLIATKNKKTKSTKVTLVVNTPYQLPEDFVSLSMIIAKNYKLSDNDYYLESDYLLISDADLAGEITMIYNFIPADMTLATDGESEPGIQAIYHSALAAYSCYHYHTMTGNLNAATVFLNEFNSVLGLGIVSQPQQQEEVAR